jgi:hypothetical protein
LRASTQSPTSNTGIPPAAEWSSDVLLAFIPRA